MSFQIAISPNRRAAARFIGKVRRALQQALADSPDIKRTNIADEIGVHRSVITRQLNGRKDISLGRVAELAWALGYEPVFKLEPVGCENGSNLPLLPTPAAKVSVQTATTAGAVIRKVNTKRMEVA